MSARDFTKVAPVLWRSPRFRGLTEAGKIGFFYIITNPHVTSAGCYVLPDGYACADLEWTAEKWVAVRDELAAAGMIDHDPERDMILVERWFRHNAATNNDHAKGTMKYLAKIDSPRLRDKAIEQFQEAETDRIARAAQKERERELARMEKVANTNPATSRLLNTRLMGGRGAP
jgi:hypothetical protein